MDPFTNALYSKFLLLLILIFCISVEPAVAICTTGVNNCVSCLSSTQCKTCSTGTFLNSVYQCQSCPMGCSACTSSTACSGCITPFVSFLGTCRCRQTYGIEYSTKTCLKCSETKCRDCYNDYRVCTYCMLGYGLSSNASCIPCLVPNCFYCNTNATTCAGCNAFYGRQNSTSCISCQDPNCNWCQYSYKSCRVCLNGFGPLADGSCGPCVVTNCLNCESNINVCNQCTANYNLTDGICEQCTVDLCNLCPINFGSCEGCMTGYGVLNNICQPCSDSKCLNCTSNPNICLTCKQMTQIGILNNSCIACSNINCEKCTYDAQYCTSCYGGYGVYPGTVCQQCSILRPKCLMCWTNATNCNLCEDGYGILNGSCSICTSNLCLKCPSNPSTCAYCTNGYGVVSGGACGPCNKTNCITCGSNVNYCDQCTTGFGVANGTCFACTNCANCSLNYFPCLQCNDKYGLLSNGSCASCKDINCIKCNSNLTCTLCSLGYGLSSSSTCLVCSGANCVNCSSNFSYCTQCSVGFGSVNGTCFACTNCLSCSPNYFPCLQCNDNYGLLNNGSCASCTDSKCIRCNSNLSCIYCTLGYGVTPSLSCLPCGMTNCTNCSQNYSVCSVCQTGYALINGKCLKCTNCLTCSSNFYPCLQCLDRYGLLINGSCVSCIDTNCLKCASNLACISCIIGYGVNPALSCLPCNMPNCISCSSNYSVCTLCQAGYALVNGQCLKCNNCLNCSPNFFPCLQCLQRYGILNNGTCSPCLDAKCLKCDGNISNCTNCQIGYGVTSTRTCSYCSMANCLNCSFNNNFCNMCITGYKASNGLCFNCTNCLQCSPQYFPCLFCMQRYGLLSNGSCESCSDSNCLKCDTNINFCTLCAPSYGPNALHACRSCVSTCLSCSQSNNSACTSCVKGKYVSNSSTCETCSLNCLSCTAADNCQQCSIGYFLDSTFYCIACPNYCSSCFLNQNYSQPQCTDCINQSFYIDNSHPPICLDLCGDSLNFENECDNQKDIMYDGCNDNCHVMPNFACQTDNLTRKSICLYTKKIGLSQIGYPWLQKYQLTFHLLVNVPLHIFSISTHQQLKQLFILGDTGLSMNRVTFDKNSKQFTIIADISTKFKFENFALYFTPSKSQKVEYSQIIQQDIMVVFAAIEKSKLAEIVQKVVEISSYANTAGAWLSFVLGLICKKAGSSLQSMMGVQICLMCLSSINSSLLSQSLYSVLRYSGGPSFNLTINRHQSRLLQQQQNSNTILSSYNFQISLSVIACIIAIITYYLLLKFKRQNSDYIISTQITETDSYLFRIFGIYEYAMEILFYFTLNSTVYFIFYFSQVFSRQNYYFDFQADMSTLEIINCSLILFSVVWFLVIAAIYITNPSTFGSVCQHYQQRKLARLYPLLYFFTIFVTIILFKFTSYLWVWFSLLPPVIFLAWTVYCQPFKQTRYNFFTFFNLVTLCLILSFTIYTKFSNLITQDTFYYWLLIIVALVLPLNIGCMIACFLYQAYLRFCLKSNDQRAILRDIKARDRAEIRLMDMEIISSQKMYQIKRVDTDNTQNIQSSNIQQKQLGQKSGKSSSFCKGSTVSNQKHEIGRQINHKQLNIQKEHSQLKILHVREQSNLNKQVDNENILSLRVRTNQADEKNEFKAVIQRQRRRLKKRKSILEPNNSIQNKENKSCDDKHASGSKVIENMDEQNSAVFMQARNHP